MYHQIADLDIYRIVPPSLRDLAILRRRVMSMRVPDGKHQSDGLCVSCLAGCVIANTCVYAFIRLRH